MHINARRGRCKSIISSNVPVISRGNVQLMPNSATLVTQKIPRPRNQDAYYQIFFVHLPTPFFCAFTSITFLNDNFDILGLF